MGNAQRDGGKGGETLWMCIEGLTKVVRWENQHYSWLLPALMTRADGMELAPEVCYFSNFTLTITGT